MCRLCPLTREQRSPVGQIWEEMLRVVRLSPPRVLHDEVAPVFRDGVGILIHVLPVVAARVVV